MDQGSRGRLAGMMALNYAVQGAWWPLLAVHLQDLGISGRARGWIFATYALGCLATPLGAGHLADKLMPTQRLLGAIYGLGALLLGLLAMGVTARPDALIGIFLLYWLITAPGYGLGAAVAFRNLPRPGEQFAGVRLWGTVGWMVAGWLVTLAIALGIRGWDGTSGAVAFAVGAALSLVFSAYCFVALPDTPPAGDSSARSQALREGLQLLRQGPVAAFLLLALAVSLTMPFIYQTVPSYLEKAGMPRAWTATAMTLSQLPEIFCLAGLPWLHRRFGLRGTMALGLGAWAAEYLMLAMQPPLAVALLAIPWNGLAIGGFVISGQMFLDSQAPPHRRASTQALWVVVASGFGSLLGSILAGEVVARSGGPGPAVYLVPGLINVVALFALMLGFKPGANRQPSDRPPVAAPAALAAGKLTPGESQP